MRRALEALIAARAARAERVRTAFLERWAPTDDFRIATPTRVIAASVAQALKEPQSRALAAEVRDRARDLGLSFIRVGNWELVRGARPRSMEHEAAIIEGARWRRWCRGGRVQSLQGCESEGEVEGERRG